VKIVRYHETGPAEVLRFDDTPRPDPGAGEVGVRAKVIGLNRSQVKFRNGG